MSSLDIGALEDFVSGEARQVRVNDRLSTVIGLVKDSKYRTQAEGSTAFFYGPFRQIFFSRDNSFFYLRTTGDLDAARAAGQRQRFAAARRQYSFHQRQPGAGCGARSGSGLGADGPDLAGGGKLGQRL